MCYTHTTHSPHARWLPLHSLSEGAHLEADRKPGCRLVSMLGTGSRDIWWQIYRSRKKPAPFAPFTAPSQAETNGSAQAESLEVNPTS